MKPSGVSELEVPSIYVTNTSSSVAFYSTNGTSFTNIGVPSGMDGSSEGIGRWAVNSDNTMWVACPPLGSTKTGIWWTINPLLGWTWKSLTSRCRGVCFDGTNFVVVGGNGSNTSYCAYASVPSGSWTTWSLGSLAGDAYDIKFHNSTYVVCGNSTSGGSGSMRTATSVGGSFTTRGNSSGPSSVISLGLDKVNNRWVGAGNNGYVTYAASSPTSTWAFHQPDPGVSTNINSVDFDPSRNIWIIGRNTNSYMFSANPPNSSSWNGVVLTLGGTSIVWDIRYSALFDKWFAVGEGSGSTALKSQTGANYNNSSWTSIAPSGFTAARSLLITG